jgi:hypothetical protein
MCKHFFVVGAQRCGTTWLYHQLAAHSEIEMAQPVRPEPKFFLLDELYQRGVGYYESTYFQVGSAALLRGEKSTSYIESEKTARRIAHHFPDTKIVMVLRDPIERAISHYWFSVQNRMETMPMAHAFFLEEERWRDYDHRAVSASPFAYLRRGKYLEQILVYESYFPSENIKVLLFEQLIGSLKQIKTVYEFLGVSSDFIPSRFHQPMNQVERLDTGMPPDLEEYLLQYYAQLNARLADHLQLDLTLWRSA